MIKSYLNTQGYMLSDGALDTYYAQRYAKDQKPYEVANLNHPKRVMAIHQEYIEAGADTIETGIFSIGEQHLECNWRVVRRTLQEGHRVAKETTKDEVKVFADIRPIVEQKNVSLAQQHQQIVDVFLAEGADYFLFETLLNTQELHAVTSYIREQCPQACAIVSFAATADGYDRRGVAMSRLLRGHLADEHVDAYGPNCARGPIHMKQLLDPADRAQKPILTMPDARYPTIPASRIYFKDSSIHFIKEMREIWQKGARLLKGYCGTISVYIRETREAPQKHKIIQGVRQLIQRTEHIPQEDHNPLRRELQKEQPVIAVGSDLPASYETEHFISHVEFLKEAGVNAVTIADCPITHVRVDSSLTACKPHRELSLDIIPHTTCRDRNISAAEALPSGLQTEGIHNVLVVTNGPIPSEDRREIKGTFNFNSQILAGYICDLNATMFISPLMVFGALNLGTVNFEAEFAKAKRRITQGMENFLIQPVHSQQAPFSLKKAREEPQAYILDGVLPIVSHRDAVYMNSEISGIKVNGEIAIMYEGITRKEVQKLTVDTSCKTVDEMRPYIDGHYLIMPFSRMEIIADMVMYIHEQ